MRHLAAALCLFFSLAHAQDQYPNRGIRLVIDTSPGGVTDLFGRMVAEGLSQKFPQGVFVDNKPGASGNLAIDFLVRSAPDGYTLMIASGGGLVVKPFLERGLTSRTPVCGPSRRAQDSACAACRTCRPRPRSASLAGK